MSITPELRKRIYDRTIEYLYKNIKPVRDYVIKQSIKKPDEDILHYIMKHIRKKSKLWNEDELRLYSNPIFEAAEAFYNTFRTRLDADVTEYRRRHDEYFRRQRDEQYRKDEMVRRQEEYRNHYRLARENLLSSIDRAVSFKSRQQANMMAHMKVLLKADQDRIYAEYVEAYERNRKENPDELRKIAHEDTIMDKLNKFVVEHADDELLPIKQFIPILDGWRQAVHAFDGREDFVNEKWYELYKTKYFEQPGTTVAYTEQPYSGLIGFKGKNKVAAIKALQPTLKETTTQVNSFPLKQNKKYQLHKVAARGTYLIDLMFSGKLTYLVAININTRYLYVQLTNTVISTPSESQTGSYSKSSKTTFLFLKALQQMMKNGMKVKHLSGDGESAFNSRVAKESFYEIYGIDFTPVKRQVMGAYPDYMKDEQKQVKTDPLHGSLGIIDRVIRTIRDMAYNMHVGNITPRIMNEIVRQYNNAPHKTLSKYAGYPVSPKMAQDDPQLEELIVRRICQENYNIMSRKGFSIPKGTKVKVYNETDKMLKRRTVIQPGEFTVDDFNRGLYKVISKNNTVQWLPRFRIAHTWE